MNLVERLFADITCVRLSVSAVRSKMSLNRGVALSLERSDEPVLERARALAT
jgi:hypothetical protein